MISLPPSRKGSFRKTIKSIRSRLSAISKIPPLALAKEEGPAAAADSHKSRAPPLLRIAGEARGGARVSPFNYFSFREHVLIGCHINIELPWDVRKDVYSSCALSLCFIVHQRLS